MRDTDKLARFNQAVVPHVDAAYNLARWLMRNPQDAEDMVQEACLRAFTFFHGFQGEDGRAWLLAIVRNTCYTWLKKNRAQELETVLEEQIDTADPEVLLFKQADRELLQHHLEQLPTEFREVLILRELDLAKSLEMEDHLRDCPACARIRDGHLNLRSTLNSARLYYGAPAAFHKRIGGALKPRAGYYRWLAAAAAVVVLFAILRTRPPAEDPIAREVLSSHIRSLMPNHLTDVPSSDQHTVKPWFNGKLDFSPAVKDLAADGFPLAGGRLDYLGGRPVAALVYQHRKHLINVFVWPSGGRSDERERAESRQGYNLLHWTHAGMTYWVASDLNRSELEQFAALFSSAR